MKNMMMLFVVGVFLGISGPVFSAEPSAQVTKVAVSDALKVAKLRQHTGVIQTVDFDEQTLVVKGRRGEKTFSMVLNTQVKRGREKIESSELMPGTKVTVRYKVLGGEKIAWIVKLPKDKTIN